MPNDGRALSLLNEYNKYRQQTWNYKQLLQKHPMRDLKPNPERLGVMDRLQQWCEENELAPERWLYSRFRIGKWRYAPRIDHLVPSAKTKQKAIAYYHSIEEAPLYTHRIQEQMAQRRQDQGQTWNVQTDIDRTVELKKLRYLRLGVPERCMENMQSETYGYHPQSSACWHCPKAYDCSQKLNTVAPQTAVVRYQAWNNAVTHAG